MSESGERKRERSVGRRVETPDVLVGVTGRLARRLSSLASGVEAALEKIAKELPLAESRLREVRMLAAAAKKEAAILEQVAEIDDAGPTVIRRVDVADLAAGAAPVLKKLEDRGVRVVVEPIQPRLEIEGDPEPLGRMVRRFSAYAGEVLGPGSIFRIGFEERDAVILSRGTAGEPVRGVRATFSLEGFRPRADDVDLDGGKLMTSIEADLRLAAAVASAERSGAEVRVERHGPRDATVSVYLRRATDDPAREDPFDPYAAPCSKAG